MTTTRVSWVSMTAATVPGHPALARALDSPVSLSGAEGATVIDARVGTNLPRLERKWTAFDGSIIYCNRQDYGALGVGVKWML